MSEREELIQTDDREELHYEEAPRSSAADNIGIFIALVALVVIGYVGYVWLTPGMEVRDILASGGSSEKASAVSSNVNDKPTGETAVAETRCPVCNMFALRSHVAVEAHWSDGSTSFHDSWICVKDQQDESGLSMASAMVRDIASGDGEVAWLEAQDAWYRIDGKAVPMSMKPFVAAYPSYSMAEADEEQGGDLIDYAALLARLEISDFESRHTEHANSEQVTVEEVASKPDNGKSTADADETVPEDAGLLVDRADFSDNSCPYCGMYADSSLTRVVVLWQDGNFSQHDSFDCVFLTIADEGRSIDQIQVTAYDPQAGSVKWLDAVTASFLYDTKSISGSMPPYVAAFADDDAALAAQADLGGEILDFNSLAARWQ